MKTQSGNRRGRKRSLFHPACVVQRAEMPARASNAGGRHRPAEMHVCTATGRVTRMRHATSDLPLGFDSLNSVSHHRSTRDAQLSQSSPIKNPETVCRIQAVSWAFYTLNWGVRWAQSLSALWGLLRYRGTPSWEGAGTGAGTAPGRKGPPSSPMDAGVPGEGTPILLFAEDSSTRRDSRVTQHPQRGSLPGVS